jgi:hypothetical protein
MEMATPPASPVGSCKSTIGEMLMINGMVYKDSLLEISNDKIIFKNYYFPSLKPKEVPIESIETD